MLTAVISTGLACGMLLAAVGLTLWGGFLCLILDIGCRVEERK